MDQACPAPFRTEHVIRLDDRPICQRDALPFDQLLANRSGRHAQLPGPLGLERAPGGLFKGVAEDVRPAMGDREGSDLQSLLLDDHARFDGDQIDVNRGTMTTDNDAKDQVPNPFKGVASGPDFQVVDRFPTGEGGEQSP